MTRYRLSWLFVALASGVVFATACGGDDDTTTGTAGKAGSGGSGGSATGGSGGVGGTAGQGGAGRDAGPTDSNTRIPCGETSCNPNATSRHCDSAAGRCVACLDDTHCANNPQNRLRCDTMTGSCRTCVTNDHCMAPQQCIRGTTNNTCQIRCMSDADCATAPGNNRACNLTTNMCVECQNNTHCAGNTSGPVCVGEDCEECGADTDCTMPGLTVCINNNCEGCRDNTQCAEPTPICVTTGTNTCRQCGSNADCASRPGLPACVQNTCRACSGSVPCPPGNRCVMNACEPLPEGGTPEAGPEAGTDGSGADTGTDAPADAPAADAADAPADVPADNG